MFGKVAELINDEDWCVWLLCDCCRRCQLVPEEHEQHDQLPDQQSRMKKFEEIQQTIEEDRPPDKPLSPSLRRINGELEEEQVTPESKCRQSSCKYGNENAVIDREWLLWTRGLSYLDL